MAIIHNDNVIIDKAGPFTGRLVDVQLSSVSRTFITQDGKVFISDAAHASSVAQALAHVASAAAGTSQTLLYIDRGTNGLAVNDEVGLVLAMSAVAQNNRQLASIRAQLKNATGAPWGHLLFYTEKDGVRSEKVRIDQDGNVGIGTSAPLYKLHVAGDYIRVDVDKGLLWNDLNSRVVYGATNGMQFFTGGAARITVLPDGRVGIGTSPGVGNQLDVAGKVNVSGDIGVSGAVDGVDVSAHAANMNAHHSETHGDGGHIVLYALLAGRGGGQVLYGGVSAGETLELRGTSHATPGQVRFHNTLNYIDANGNLIIAGNLKVGDGAPATPAVTFVSDPDTGLYRGGADDLRLVTGGGARVVIDASGNVGINVLPGAGNRLDVGGKINASGDINAGANLVASGRLLVSDGSIGSPAIGFTSDPDTGLFLSGPNDLRVVTGGAVRVIVDASGNVGIGVPPGAGNKLDVAGKVKASALDVTDVFYTETGQIIVRAQDTVNEGGQIQLLGAGTNRYFYLDNNGGNMRVVTQDAVGESEKFRITNAGAVWAGVPLRQVINTLGQALYA